MEYSLICEINSMSVSKMLLIPFSLVGILKTQRVADMLKVPKCEIFDPFFFTPINPIWVGDLRTGEKKKIFEDHGRYSPFCFFYAG